MEQLSWHDLQRRAAEAVEARAACFAMAFSDRRSFLV